MASPDPDCEPRDSRRGPTIGETTRDFLTVLLSVGAALLAVGGVLAALEGQYATAATNAIGAGLLAYLYFRFGRIRRKAAVHNLNL